MGCGAWIIICLIWKLIGSLHPFMKACKREEFFIILPLVANLTSCLTSGCIGTCFGGDFICFVVYGSKLFIILPSIEYLISCLTSGFFSTNFIGTCFGGNSICFVISDFEPDFGGKIISADSDLLFHLVHGIKKIILEPRHWKAYIYIYLQHHYFYMFFYIDCFLIFNILHFYIYCYSFYL